MEENKQLDSLIVVEQLPIITQQLQLISEKIDEKIDYALSLECNEESKNIVKKEKANLNKIKDALEEKRKQVKSAVMQPYNEFEELYNNFVKEKLSKADNTLKERISNIENEQLKEKQEEIELFAKQHFEFNEIDDIVSFKDINLKITLSASIKSLKEQVLAFVDKILNDLKLIELEEYKDEIMVEYKETLDFTTSKLRVCTRHKQLEELKQRQEELSKQKEQEEKVIEKVEEVVEEITIPQEIIEEEEIISATFTITDTKENIIKVREFMKKEGIKYE